MRYVLCLLVMFVGPGNAAEENLILKAHALCQKVQAGCIRTFCATDMLRNAAFLLSSKELLDAMTDLKRALTERIHSEHALEGRLLKETKALLTDLGHLDPELKRLHAGDWDRLASLIETYQGVKELRTRLEALAKLWSQLSRQQQQKAQMEDAVEALFTATSTLKDATALTTRVNELWALGGGPIHLSGRDTTDTRVLDGLIRAGSVQEIRFGEHVLHTPLTGLTFTRANAQIPSTLAYLVFYLRHDYPAEDSKEAEAFVRSLEPYRAAWLGEIDERDLPLMMSYAKAYPPLKGELILVPSSP